MVYGLVIYHQNGNTRLRSKDSLSGLGNGRLHLAPFQDSTAVSKDSPNPDPSRSCSASRASDGPWLAELHAILIRAASVAGPRSFNPQWYTQHTNLARASGIQVKTQDNII